MAVLYPDKIGRERALRLELERIVPLLIAEGAEKVILFGSLATGELSSKSDLDLIVIKRTSQRLLDRLDSIYSSIVPRLALDLLVLTPEEFSELSSASYFVRKAISEGQTLYEKAEPSRS